MITFKQFISEQDDWESALKNLLETRCGPFLKESQNNGLLWRGLKRLNDNDAMTVSTPLGESNQKVEYWEKSVRTDRKPKDTHSTLHKRMDDWFEDKFGIRARSAGMFCLGDRGAEHTRLYGEVYMVFPIGEFKYVWSPKIPDLFIVTQVDRYREEGVLEHLLETSDYTSSALEKAVKSSCEVMMVCKNYIAIPERYEADVRKALRQVQ